VTRRLRFLAALVASCCAPLAFASLASAQEVLYGADGGGGGDTPGVTSNLYLLNPSSGALLQTIGPIGFAVTGLAEDPSTGTLYGVTSLGSTTNPGSLITVNKTTGAGTLVGDERSGDTAFPEGAADITFTPASARRDPASPPTLRASSSSPETTTTARFGRSIGPPAQPQWWPP
jgi:hypothetical protein